MWRRALVILIYYFLEYEKLGRLVQRETTAAERIPLLFFKFVSSLDESITATLAREKEAARKLNPNNARALNQMKQRVRKTIKEQEADFKRWREVRIAAASVCSNV